jgi:hypothetical protein
MWPAKEVLRLPAEAAAQEVDEPLAAFSRRVAEILQHSLLTLPPQPDDLQAAVGTGRPPATDTVGGD